MSEFQEIMQAVSRSLLKMPQKDYAATDRKPSMKFEDNKISGANAHEAIHGARKGGKVVKSGRVKLHRGESVVRSKNRRGRSR
jgi:hypothetical protein